MSVAGSLIQSELHNLKDYYQRVSLKLESQVNYKSQINTQIEEFYDDQLPLVFKNLGLKLDLATNTPDKAQAIWDLFNFFDQFLKMVDLDSQQQNSLINFINEFYEFSEKLKNICFHEFPENFQGPRLGIIQTIPSGNKFGKSYYFDFQKFALTLKSISTKNKVFNFANKRSRFHHDLLFMGKEAVARKDYAEAFRLFSKALDIQVSAEALTLLGWAHSFLGRIEEAKECCLTAIAYDPDYGNPYNDLGSYYLQENKTELAKEWFVKAKDAVNYANREYPFINLGKIYVMEREFDLALKEFRAALALAPESQDIKNTLEKLEVFLNSHKTANPRIDQSYHV